MDALCSLKMQAAQGHGRNMCFKERRRHRAMDVMCALKMLLRRATSGIGSVSFRCSFDFAKRAIKFNTYSPISELNSSTVEEQLPGYWLPN